MYSRIKNRFRLLKNYINHRTVVEAGPPEIGIDSTNRCNLNCIMCPRQEMTRPLGDMDLGLFKKIIDDGSCFLEFVWLQDYGDPLLHKDILSMISYCRKKKIPCGISTNALLLDKELGEEILGAELDYILFAFDGATEETYEQIRKGSNYKRVVENIRNFLKVKERKRAKIFVAIQCIYMKETEDQIGAFRKMWLLPGVNALRIRQLTYSASRYGSQSRFKNPISDLPCYWLWRNPHIKWDGTMVACCQDVNAIYNLGNLKDSSLTELWDGQVISDLRRVHLDGRRKELSLCRNCNMYQPNLALGIGAFIFNSAAINRWIPNLETMISSLRYRHKNKESKRI